jgi:hypothetical protein
MITELETNPGGALPTATERDLAAAAQLQRMSLPPSPFVSNGWKAVHRFEPAGIVSGDYIDLARQAAGGRIAYRVPGCVPTYSVSSEPPIERIGATGNLCDHAGEPSAAQ